MKAKEKFILLIICLVAGIVFLMWGNYVMKNYDGYKEAQEAFELVSKPARHEAMPITIIGGVLFIIGYFLTFVKPKK